MATNNLTGKILAAIGLYFAFTTCVVAQKTAFVASDAILDRYPDAQAARTKLAELQNSWLRDIDKMEADRTKLLEDMQTNRLLWSPQERKEADAKLHDLEAKLAAFRSTKFGPNGEFEQKQKEYMGPVFDKVQKAIEEVAQSQKYDFVFDKSSRGLPMLYGNSSYDITAFVLKRLGVEVADSALPKPPVDANQSDAAKRNRGRRAETPDAKLDPNEMLDPNKEQQPAGQP